MKDTEGFNFVCKVSELKDKIGKRFYINNTDIAVFKVDNKIYALSNICSHQHIDKIFEGYIEDGCVICPIHGWAFKLENGNVKGGSRGIESFPIKIIDDKIYINVIEKKINW